jgi:hypothetical protein
LQTFYGGAIYDNVICLATGGIRHIIIEKEGMASVGLK